MVIVALWSSRAFSLLIIFLLLTSSVIEWEQLVDLLSSPLSLPDWVGMIWGYGLAQRSMVSFLGFTPAGPGVVDHELGRLQRLTDVKYQVPLCQILIFLTRPCLP